MKIEINNLTVQMQGRSLAVHQRADALIEFNKLVEYTEELEKQVKNKVDLANVSNGFEECTCPDPYCDACHTALSEHFGH